MIRGSILLVAVLALGCIDLPLEQQGGSSVVPSDLFGSRPVSPTIQNVSFAPASTEMSQRVDRIGRKILADNPEIGLKPYFATIGDAREEIFHDGTKMLWITSGLVERCRKDSDLAALLSLELAKMVADREMLASPSALDPEEPPPIRAPIGNASRFDSADRTYLVELAKFEKRKKQRQAKRRPDTNVLAGNFLENAGYQASDLEAVTPLVRAAQKHFVFEKQFRRLNQSQWRPGT